MDVQRDEPLSKLILNEFQQNFEKEDNFVEDYKYLQRKNKVIDIMDDYYTRHISKGIKKPDHLFMFKAQPIIPPGRILLEMERENEKLKVKGPKIKVGNSEISLFSPARGKRERFEYEYFSQTNPVMQQRDDKEGDFSTSFKRGSIKYQMPSSIVTSNKDLNEVIREKSNLQRSMEFIKSASNNDTSLNESTGFKVKSREFAKSPHVRQNTFKLDSPNTAYRSESKPLTQERQHHRKSEFMKLCSRFISEVYPKFV